MMYPRLLLTTSRVVSLAAILLHAASLRAGTLDASFARVPEGSVVDLTAEGNLDWVHWGLITSSDVNRKASVIPRISNFELVWDSENSNAWAFAFHFADHFNGYSWSDGTPEMSITNTTTGVWAYGTPPIGSGFQITVPADPTLKTLKVYVGTFAGRGLFSASLSDNSAPAYQNSSLLNMRNGEGGVYTIDFAADEPGETLTITWTLLMLMAPDANVTLQAAALSIPGGNNPPIVSLTSPEQHAQIPFGDPVLLQATATDLDGSVSSVAFFDGTNRLGEALAEPFEWTWTGAELGPHEVTAVARDDGGAESGSIPVDLFVHSNEGGLTGESADPPATVNLTEEGTFDWVHWGLTGTNAPNRKAGVAAQIGDFVSLGTRPIQTYSNNFTAFSWTDGEPLASASDTPTGVFATGIDGGFEVWLPADTTLRRARVYAGLYGAVGEFHAFLSDASAPAYVDTSLTNVFNSEYVRYTLDYRAGSPGQSLILRHRPSRLFDLLYGNVTLQAVTLSGDGEEPPAPVVLLEPAMAGGDFQFSFEARAGREYVVEYANQLPGGLDWQVWTNLSGAGERIMVNVPPGSAGQRFYRVETR